MRVVVLIGLLLIGLVLLSCGGQPTPTLLIKTVQLHRGQEGNFYSGRLEAQGGIPPYHWTIVGDLPPYLELNPETGEISGYLSYEITDGEHPEDFFFDVIVTDSSQ